MGHKCGVCEHDVTPTFLGSLYRCQRHGLVCADHVAKTAGQSIPEICPVCGDALSIVALQSMV